ncbi:hypothetical protein ACFL36_01460 [Thermodesulfobacteriota bacterium]
MKDKGKKDKLPIDRLREGAGSLEISTPDDDSSITGMISLRERLLVFKGKGIYEVKLADKVDPERKNIHAPNTIQRVLPYGSDHPWVGAVVLTAHELLKSTILVEAIDCDGCMDLVIDIAQDIAGYKKLVENYAEEQEAAMNGFNSKIRKDRSVLIPAIGNVLARCKEFLQKSDHTLKGLFKIVKFFYSDVGTGGWGSLKSKINKEPQGVDNFSQFLESVLPLLQMVRNARNCVEHPRPEQRIVISDFSVDPNNHLLLPMLEIIHPKTPLNKIPVAEFMNHISEEIVNIVELMLVFLCSRHVRPFAGFPVQVFETPVDRRRSPNVRYGYGVANEDTFIPFG